MPPDAPSSESGSSPVEVTLLANTDHAVIVADADGVITFWNPAAEAMFGHSRASVLGEKLDLIIPEKLRAPHWEGYEKVMATGETQYHGRTLAVPAIRADGTRISIEFTVTLLQDADGKVTGIGAFMRDVTERWEQQREQRKRLVALEREVAELKAAAVG